MLIWELSISAQSVVAAKVYAEMKKDIGREFFVKEKESMYCAGYYVGLVANTYVPAPGIYTPEEMERWYEGREDGRGDRQTRNIEKWRK